MNALDFAAGIARIHDSEIHLFHAYPEPSTEVPPFSSEGIEGSINIPVDYKAIEEEVESKLIKLCVDFRRKLAEKGLSDIKISHSKASGVVDQKIKNALSDFNPDIIVLGTKGRGKKNNSFIGRVTSKIIRLTEKPVLAIPQFTKPESFMNSEIMFATNFDHTDPSSLKTLIKMAEPFNSNIHCVHIGDKDIDNVIKLRLKHLEDEFKNVPTNCKLTFEYIDDNNPLERLQDYILEHEIKIISLTMHRYNFITSLFRPSFTEKVLFHTNVPVLIFHA
jgi:nucleotide-binding universal stress UspA family protein